MSLHVARGSVLAVLAMFVILVGPAHAQPAKQDEEVDLNDLSLEVNALQTLQTLDLSEPQLRQLKNWAAQTAQKAAKREPAKASKEYKDKLLELRAALVDASDADKINQLNEELDELREAQKPTLDDGVELSAVARKRAPEALRLLKVQQFTTYLAALADGLADPLDRLLDALPNVRDLKGDEWKQRREEIVDEIVRLGAGVDSAKADRLTDQTTILLSQAHSMTEAQFKAKRPKLEKAARALLGEIGPLDVSRMAVERGLAELLSNPRLTAALEARLKKGG
jgi:hypothetical protein